MNPKWLVWWTCVADCAMVFSCSQLFRHTASCKNKSLTAGSTKTTELLISCNIGSADLSTHTELPHTFLSAVSTPENTHPAQYPALRRTITSRTSISASLLWSSRHATLCLFVNAPFHQVSPYCPPGASVLFFHPSKILYIITTTASTPSISPCFLIGSALWTIAISLFYWVMGRVPLSQILLSYLLHFVLYKLIIVIKL